MLPSEDSIWKDIADMCCRLESKNAMVDEIKADLMATLRYLMTHHDYTLPEIATKFVVLKHPIWLYAVPTPPGKISINPVTKFQKHLVVRLFFGTQEAFMSYLLGLNDATRHLTECGFEEGALGDN